MTTKPCLHSNFLASVNVYRLGEHPENTVTGYTAEVRVQCSDCGTPFAFMGLPGGSNPDFPTVSADGLEARMPITPHGGGIR